MTWLEWTIGGATIAGLLAYIIRQRRQLAALRIEYECEMQWADEYCRQAIKARSELDRLTREHKALQMAHTRVTVPMMTRAWRNGTSKSAKEEQ